MSPFTWSFKRRRSCDGGLSVDCGAAVCINGASCRGGDLGKFDVDEGGEGMASILWCELGPLRNGFLICRGLFSGDGGRSKPLAPLFERPPKTVPKRLKPPKLFFGGAAGAVEFLVVRLDEGEGYILVPALEAVEYGLGFSSSWRTCSRDGVRVGGAVAAGIGAGAGSAAELLVVALLLGSRLGPWSEIAAFCATKVEISSAVFTFNKAFKQLSAVMRFLSTKSTSCVSN